MAVSCRAGAFNTGTGAIGTTVDVIPSDAVTISGISAVILFIIGRTETVDTNGRATRVLGVGAAVSSTDRFAQVSQSQDATAAATGGSYHSNAACIASVAVGTATDGLLDFDSWLSNGFRLIVDDVMPISYRVGYLLFTGLDNAATGTWLDTSTTGDKIITTALSFQPDVEFLLATVIDTAAPGGRAGNEMMGLGFAVSTTLQAAQTGGNDEGSASGDTDSYCLDEVECLASMTSGGGSVLASRWSFVSHNSNGFTLNQIIVPATLCYNHFLAMKGGSWTVKSVATQTDTTTDITTSALGFDPAGIFVISACKTEHTAGTPTIHDTRSIGVAHNASNRFCAALIDEDGVADMEVTTAIEHDNVYASINTSSVVEGLMDVQTWADPLVFRMRDADPSAKFVTMLVVGNVAAGGGRITKNTDPRPLGIFAGVSRKVNTHTTLFQRSPARLLMPRGMGQLVKNMNLLHHVKKENSGLFRTTLELANYEEKAGHKVVLREPQGGVIYGHGNNPDIELVHSQLPITGYHNGKPKAMWMHGEPLSSVGNGVSMKAIVDLAPLMDFFICMRREEQIIWNSIKRTYLVPKGVDLDMYYPLEGVTERLSGEPAVLYVENWRGSRNPLYLCVAMQIVWKKYPNARLHLFNCTDKRMKETFSALIQHNKWWTFLRTLSGQVQDVNTLYNRADIVVSCLYPLYARSIEAFGAGKAFISPGYKEPGYPWTCELQPESMAQAIIDCFENYDKINYREWAEANHDVKETVKQSLEIYTRYIG